MPNDEVPAPEPALPEGLFEGRLAFHAHLQTALDAAARLNWREIVLADPDFLDWPLGERAVVDALQAWSASGRSLVLLAQRFDVFAREHARFVNWRRMWSHIVDARACNGPGLPPVPSAIWTPGWSVHRIDPAHGRGVSSSAADARRALRERIDECLRHARPAFPATTLGL
ncbi:hypothetical protein QTH87_11295 [Variovorax sp. J22P168]|uniref:hypothetical protein n=1 Tax=Variovorax jilinensis TaxID=3053513 RepID=UPI0025774602|nr:hypothetical protein [Variovorax sp. J22P168]MDM0013017.1 hypothetical protein [Variovorax sp. J22P168]